MAIIEKLLALAEEILVKVREFDAAGIIAIIKEAFATIFAGTEAE